MSKFKIQNSKFSDGDPKAAIVCDWLIGGGAELVVEQLHRMYPDAPIYTSYATPQWRKRLDNKVVTGWLQHLGRIRKFIPFLRIWWFSRLDLSAYDLVISSSGAEAKFVKTKPNTLHIAYIHAPTHYYWSRYDEYLKNPGFGALNWIARLGLRLLVAPLRKRDYQAAQRPDYLIANSTHIQSEIKKYYNRTSTVIHPPVDTERFKPRSKAKRSGYVVAGRQVPYKRIDLAITACTELGLDLTVIGRGSEHHALKSIAGSSIKFVTNASDKDIARYFQNAEAFIFPGLEDFGIVAVEALAAGTPIIAYNSGGSSDFITENINGIFFDDQTPQSLVKAIKQFQDKKWDHTAIQKSAAQFDAPKFQKKIAKFIDSKLA